MKSVLYLLCGLPGSGKTTYAKSLEENNNVFRFTLDEEIVKRYGQDFDPADYDGFENETEKTLLDKVKLLLSSGKSVVLDYGFWKKEKRDKYKKMAGELGAEWKLVYFECPMRNLRNRLKERNKRSQNDAQMVTIEMLEDFEKQFEVPDDEGEIKFL